MLLAATISGCATAATDDRGHETSTRSPSARPSSSTSTEPTVLIIGPTGLTAVNEDGATLSRVDYSTGQRSVTSFVASVLGDPDTTVPDAAESPTSVCLGGDPGFAGWALDGSWGLMVTHSNSPVFANAPLVIATTSHVGEIAVRTSDGASVGASSQPIIDALDDPEHASLTDQVPEGGSSTKAFVADWVGTAEVHGATVAYGVAIAADSGTVVTIGAPSQAAVSTC